MITIELMKLMEKVYLCNFHQVYLCISILFRSTYNKVNREIRYTLEAIENSNVCLLVSEKYFEKAEKNGNKDDEEIIKIVNNKYKKEYPELSNELCQTISTLYQQILIINLNKYITFSFAYFIYITKNIILNVYLKNILLKKESKSFFNSKCII